MNQPMISSINLGRLITKVIPYNMYPGGTTMMLHVISDMMTNSLSCGPLSQLLDISGTNPAFDFKNS